MDNQNFTKWESSIFGCNIENDGQKESLNYLERRS